VVAPAVPTMNQRPKIRAFLAMEPDDRTRHELAEAMLALKQVEGLRLTPAENLHVTLKFLGDVPADQIDDVTAATEMAIERIAPFSLELTGAAYLPNERGPKLLAATFDKPTMLSLLHGQIETMFTEIGFAREDRPYRPHMTLGRFKQVPRGPLPRPTWREDCGFLVRSVALVRSELRPTGPIYTTIDRFDLAG
jgi:2'-5' RNA ligase